MDLILLVVILVLTVASFVLEWLPIDVTALASLGALLLCNLITPGEAVEGFANPAVITVMMMFILSEALVQSGVVARIGYRIARLAKGSDTKASSTLLLLCGGLSAFINNTATVSIFMPVALDLAKRYKISPAKILMPLSYAAIFGGTCTLIGTSTNLLVSALAEEHGLPPFSVFEFLYLGGLLFILGMAYNLIFAPGLLPEREVGTSLTGKYHMTGYLTEVKIPSGSSLLGRTVLEEQISDRFRMNVVEILRGREKIASDIRYTPIEPEDILIVRGPMEDILAFKESYDLLLLSDIKLQDSDLADRNNILAEVQLSPNSQLTGATLREIDFRKRFGCFVLALDRIGGVIRDKVAFVPLKGWDTLLVFGPRQRIEALATTGDFLPLQELSVRLGLSGRWWVGAFTIPLVVLLAALGVMSILKSAILGVVLLLVTRTLRIQKAYEAIDWSVIFMLAAILPMGTAMEETGLAGMIGDGIVGFGEWMKATVGGPSAALWGAMGVLAVITLVTSLITGFISNNTAAVLMVPIAYSASVGLGVSSKPLLMGVAFSASMCFFTPMGYQTNTMVYGPGGYRFMDYVRAGGPLNVLFWLAATLLIPWIWDF
jgi:di/tricarboxylate transporter